MSDPGDDESPLASDRAAGLAGGLLLPALWLWSTRGEWEMAVPAWLVTAVIGLLAMGAHRTAVRLAGRRPSLRGLFFSGASVIALATAAAAWHTEGGLHWRSAVGSVAAGAAVACWLIFLRLLAWGAPEGGTEELTVPSPKSSSRRSASPADRGRPGSSRPRVGGDRMSPRGSEPR